MVSIGQAVLGDCNPHVPDWIATNVTSRQDEFERTAIPHSRGLLRVARRLESASATAEDLVQETFYRRGAVSSSFRPGRIFERGFSVFCSTRFTRRAAK